MTQIFQDDGTVIPVTKIFVEPCRVTQVKTFENDGYSAVQIACGRKRKINKPLRGHLRNFPARYIKEFRIQQEEEQKYRVGDEINVKIFKEGDIIKISGTAKGRGFQGVVKRHGFSGGPASHGQKDQLRMPGSIGATGPQRVFKGKKMPGRMGGNQVTVRNLKIVKVDEKDNILYVKGAVPGARNSLVSLRSEGESNEGKQE